MFCSLSFWRLVTRVNVTFYAMKSSWWVKWVMIVTCLYCLCNSSTMRSSSLEAWELRWRSSSSSGLAACNALGSCPSGRCTYCKHTHIYTFYTSIWDKLSLLEFSELYSYHENILKITFQDASYNESVWLRKVQGCFKWIIGFENMFEWVIYI